MALFEDPNTTFRVVSIHAEALFDVEHHLLDGGYFMTLGRNGCSFFCYRQPRGVYWSYVVHARSEAEVADQSKEALLKRVNEETAGWHQLVRRLVAEAATDSVGVRGYYDKEPTSHVHDGRAWMIGDAAHPMCPFQGQGANMAMMDAVRLAGLIASGPQPADEAAVEADIAKRGRKAVMDSRGNARRFHATSALARYQRDLVFRLANVVITLLRRRD